MTKHDREKALWRETKYRGYWVSTEGKVISLGGLKRKPKFLKGSLRLGYPRICISMGKKRKDVCVHTLIAETFIGKRPRDHEVNHKDFNRQNNRVENLEYVTKEGNRQHAIAHGRRVEFQPGERHPSAKLTSEQVRHIRSVWKSDKRKDGNTSKLAKKFGVTTSAVCKVVRDVTWAKRKGEM